MIQVCDLSFANSSITDTLGNYSLVSSGTVTISDHTYPANTDPILYGTDSSYNYVEFGQTATYSNGAIIQAGVPTYGSENWAVEFRARVTGAMPEYYENYEIFYGCRAPYDNNGTTRMAGHWSISISISNSLGALEFAYVDHYDSLVIKDNLDFTSWHLYKVTKTAEEILTLHIDGVLVATINLEQQIGYKTHATLGSFALLGVVNEFPVDNRIQTNQSVRLADVKVYADPMGHAEKAISLDNLSRVFRNYNTWLGAQLSGQIGDGTLTIKVNGSTAGTFTANQSTNATANIVVPTAVSELTNDSGYLTSSSNLDASRLTSGTVDIERLPQGALERLVKVANEAARYALTTADVQLGDTVQQLDTGIMYVVTDIDHLDSAAGYTEYTAGTAASVPWSGVTGKPTFAAVATSGAYSDLTGTPTIPTVNDATLTIQQNGTTVDTFTANSSTDKTVNIQCVDLTNNQTVGGDKEFTGTTTAHDLVPSATDTYNFGSSSYQWNNAYIKSLTINGVVCGDILTHNVSEFVGVTGAQTIGGQKIFTHGSTGLGRDIYHFASNPYGKNTPPANTSFQYIWFGGNTASQGFTNSWYSSFIEVVINTNGATRGRWSIRDTSESIVGLELWVNGSNKQVKPQGNNVVDLGTSTNKWKSFNGVEPSDLSLPSDTSITIDTTGFTWGANFTFTPSVNGYLFINIPASTGIRKLSLKTGRGEYYFSNQIDILRFTMPVYKGKLVTISANSTVAETVIPSLSLFPCQGNV